MHACPDNLSTIPPSVALPAPAAVTPFGARRYNAWNDEVRRRYGGRVQKVSVAAGFTCPNRDGVLGTGGCTFCNNAGFTPGYLDRRDSIHTQIDTGLRFLDRRYPGTARFIAYFQSYSNTYGEFERLRDAPGQRGAAELEARAAVEHAALRAGAAAHGRAGAQGQLAGGALRRSAGVSGGARPAYLRKSLWQALQLSCAAA